jgi:3-deoxy-manno-octulosonate cytidylyltransferase (CMP-KDO synthetase)
LTARFLPLYKRPTVRTIIIIPARMQATRLFGKPLAELAGVPVVVQVARQAQLCPGVTQVVVATDAQVIFAAARDHGIDALMTGSQHQSGTDRVAEAAARLEAQWVINVQGDEPFVDPTALHDVVRAVHRNTADIVTLSRPIYRAEEAHDPAVVKVVCRDNGEALYFSRSAIPHLPSCTAATAAPRSPLVMGHVGVYGCSRSVLQAWSGAPPHPLERAERLEQLRALAMGLRIAVLPCRMQGRGIDTPADLAWARERVAALGAAAFPTFCPGDSP